MFRNKMDKAEKVSKRNDQRKKDTRIKNTSKENDLLVHAHNFFVVCPVKYASFTRRVIGVSQYLDQTTYIQYISQYIKNMHNICYYIKNIHNNIIVKIYEKMYTI